MAFRRKDVDQDQGPDPQLLSDSESLDAGQDAIAHQPALDRQVLADPQHCLYWKWLSHNSDALADGLSMTLDLPQCRPSLKAGLGRLEPSKTWLAEPSI
jgi:hypothetical protein